MQTDFTTGAQRRLLTLVTALFLPLITLQARAQAPDIGGIACNDPVSADFGDGFDFDMTVHSYHFRPGDLTPLGDCVPEGESIFYYVISNNDTSGADINLFRVLNIDGVAIQSVLVPTFPVPGFDPADRVNAQSFSFSSIAGDFSVSFQWSASAELPPGGWSLVGVRALNIAATTVPAEGGDQAADELTEAMLYGPALCTANSQCDDCNPGTVDSCDPTGTEPPSSMCTPNPTDSDGDGTSDCVDECPNDPNKIEEGECGCGVPEGCNDPPPSDCTTDADCDDGDPCTIGTCVAQNCQFAADGTDSDNDGTPDCEDECPNDPDKTEPGACGCGEADVDTDEDGTLDCDDGCPDDPDKTAPGICGCGIAEDVCNPPGCDDADEDGVCDVNDNCVDDANSDQADCDNDDIGDVCDDVVGDEECFDGVDNDCDGLIDFDDEDCASVNAPPVAAFVVNTLVGLANETEFAFDASLSTDLNNDPLTFEWDFGDGETDTGVSVVHVFAEPSEPFYTVTLTVTDPDGESDTAESEDILVTANLPPTAVAMATGGDTAPAVWNFDGSESSDPEDSPLTFAWEIVDDGGDVLATLEGEIVNYTFQNGGTFTLTLTVADPAGQEDSADPITITLAQAPAGNGNDNDSDGNGNDNGSTTPPGRRLCGACGNFNFGAGLLLMLGFVALRFVGPGRVRRS